MLQQIKYALYKQCYILCAIPFLFKFHKINTKISDYKQKCGMFLRSFYTKIYILSFIFLMSPFVIKKMNSFQFVFNEHLDFDYNALLLLGNCM